MKRSRAFETAAVHAGSRIGVGFLPTIPPIHPSTTFTYPTVRSMHEALAGNADGFAYSRNANPTVVALEEAVGQLEGSDSAVAFGSGMAAIHGAVLATGAQPGDKILAARDMYGTSRSLLTSLFRDMGFAIELVDTTQLDHVESAIKRGAKALCFEPISNPLLRVMDVRALVALAHQQATKVVIDSTFVTPVLLRPVELGADFVVHSASKYLGGHGDVIAGVVACGEEDARALRSIRTLTGGVLGPFEAWLVLRGIRTLALRVRRQCRNAEILARWFSERDEVRKVYYPGLSDRGDQELVRKQFSDGLAGGVVTIDTGLDLDCVERLMDALELAVPGTTLGDVETLVLSPALSSHRTLTRDERENAGIADGLLRVSLGIEDPKDLIEDFEQALRTVYTPIATTVS